MSNFFKKFKKLVFGKKDADEIMGSIEEFNSLTKSYEEAKDLLFSSFTEFAEGLEANFLSFSPVLFTRERNNHKFAKFISGICQEIKRTNDIPQEVLKFLKSKEVCDTARNETEEPDKPGSLEDYLLPLFPLPSNDEQKDSLKLLHDQDTLIIKGLPGTGKTQTAVNLACHFLSHGKKVLVTSENEMALSSFFKKMPGELSPLLFQDIQNGHSNKNKYLMALESSLFSILKKNQNTSIPSLEEKIQSLTLTLTM